MEKAKAELQRKGIRREVRGEDGIYELEIVRFLVRPVLPVKRPG